MYQRAYLLLIILGLRSTDGIAIAQTSAIGSAAPRIAIREWVSGEMKGSNPFRGKTVVLEFWATWCAPCVAAIPHLNRLAKKFASKDVIFLSITAEQRQAVEKFLSKKPIISSVVLDSVIGGHGITHRAYGVKAIPHTVLIDTKGIIRWRGYPTDLTEERFERYLRAGVVPPPEQELQEDRIASVTSENVLYWLVVKRSRTLSPDPRLRGLGMLRTQFDTDTSELEYRGGSFVDFISKLLRQPTTRITVVGEPPPDIFDLTLRVIARLPDSVLALRAVQAVSDVFGMQMDYIVEHRKGWALMLAHADRLPHSAMTSGYSTAFTDSTWTGIGVTLAVFAHGLEAQLQQHVFDETNASGKFDFDVRTDDVKTLRRTLEERYGIVMREVERPVRIVRLTFR